MKIPILKSAPRPNPAFARKLEQKLLAQGSWKEKTSIFNFSNFMERYSFISASVLLLLAVSGGLLYPFTQKPKDYVAQANEYYDNYNWESILYQKKQIYFSSPEETSDADATYILETWTHGDDRLILAEKIAGELWEMVSSDEMYITDEFGNNYMYGNPKQFGGLKKTPIVEAPYCIQSLSAENGDSIIYSFHAFEASPSALDAFNTIYLPKNVSYAFDEDGEFSQYAYIENYSYYISKKEQDSQEPAENIDLYEAINRADSSPEQAKLLFDFLSEGQAYTQTTKMNANGEVLHVFRLPPVAYNSEYSDAQSIQEFTFNDQFQLVESSSYKDGKLMEQTKYLETKVLPLSEKDTIFNPKAYGMELVTFDHGVNENEGPIVEKGSANEFICYSFQNELLPTEETQKLAEDYAPMIQNIKDYWKPEPWNWPGFPENWPGE